MKTYHSNALGIMTIPAFVSEDEACPSCGEDNMDRLVWDDDDRYDEEVVRCGTCGVVYNPWGAS